MSTNTRRGPAGALVLGLLALALSGCQGSGEDVTTRSLLAARRTWEKAKVRDYNLEWTTAGARKNHYRVFVRDGRVRAVYLVQPDGKEVVGKPGEPAFFGVDGLFRTIEEELDEAQSDQPFGQRKGTRVVLKFTPDPALGYPRDYRRDVLGSPLRIAIDVIRMDAHPPEAIPPPRTS